MLAIWQARKSARRMRVILIASQKGGAGKSTLAAHFAALADAEKGRAGRPALLVDCDPQGSLAFWHERRERETPILVRALAGEAADVLADAKARGVQWAIVDSPPHNAPLVNALMRQASLVVVPVRPAPFDLAAAGVTLEAATALGANVVALLNQAPPPTKWGEASIAAQARDVLARFRVPVLEGQVSRRAALERALIEGASVTEFEPDGPAAREISAAWAQVAALAGKAEPAGRKRGKG